MTTYPELCCGTDRARLVVIAGEFGDRWSAETKTFLWCLASAKAASTTRRLFGSARAAQQQPLHSVVTLVLQVDLQKLLCC